MSIENPLLSGNGLMVWQGDLLSMKGGNRKVFKLRPGQRPYFKQRMVLVGQVQY
jgi:hypothetical protein